MCLLIYFQSLQKCTCIFVCICADDELVNRSYKIDTRANMICRKKTLMERNSEGGQTVSFLSLPPSLGGCVILLCRKVNERDKSHKHLQPTLSSLFSFITIFSKRARVPSLFRNSHKFFVLIRLSIVFECERHHNGRERRSGYYQHHDTKNGRIEYCIGRTTIVHEISRR